MIKNWKEPNINFVPYHGSICINFALPSRPAEAPENKLYHRYTVFISTGIFAIFFNDIIITYAIDIEYYAFKIRQWSK